MKTPVKFVSATELTENKGKTLSVEKKVSELSIDMVNSLSLEEEPEHSPVYISPRHQYNTSSFASITEANLPSIPTSPLETQSPPITRIISAFPLNSATDFQEKISAATRLTTTSCDEIKFTETDYKCVAGKIYCENCGENVFTQTFCRNVQEGLWEKFMCGICLKGMRIHFQEIVHVCLDCGSEVAKIKIKRDSLYQY
ncbi:hypothetical protein SteCoe_27388 [Stentor coeruleus]|uniref:Uncharacterized protein n=1 Tax=Stentor coeruleus TaxID=5963 RepID=A0A1R2BAN3_9CILI|nr:hypothetical protein SteCoe_27388 [Stentor coeruleus]